MIFSHSGDPGLTVGGWVGLLWVQAQDMGPARLLYRVTGPGPAYFVERTQISVAVGLSSWAGQFFQRKSFSHPPGRKQLGYWDCRGKEPLRSLGTGWRPALLDVGVWLSPTAGPGYVKSGLAWSDSAELPVSEREGRRGGFWLSLCHCPLSSSTFWGHRCLLQPW